jgi:hypothetical protein
LLAFGYSSKVLFHLTTSLRTNTFFPLQVDMSIIESFAQGGRAAITTRVYPQVANDANSRVVVFNNGTLPVTLRQLDAYHIEGVSFRTLY